MSRTVPKYYGQFVRLGSGITVRLEDWADELDTATDEFKEYAAAGKDASNAIRGRTCTGRRIFVHPMEVTGPAPPSLQEFWELCNRHDWFFQMSDDHSVWSAGMHRKAQLEHIARTAGHEYAEMYGDWLNHVYEEGPKPKKPEKQT